MANCGCTPVAGLSMMQGDSWPIELNIKLNGEPVDVNRVKLVEVSVDSIIKRYPGEVSYDAATKLFRFPVTQQESFSLHGSVRVQARVKYDDGVVGLDFGLVDITNSLSKEVL